MSLNVTLPQDIADFVETKVSGGHYASPSDVIRDALRLLEATDLSGADLARLQAAWQAGIESGDAGEIDFGALKAEARARLASSKA